MRLKVVALMVGYQRVRCLLLVVFGWGTVDGGSRSATRDTPRVVGSNIVGHDDSPSLVGHGYGSGRPG